MIRLGFLFASYFAVLAALFLYSLTQIDLSLTFSKLSVWQAIEKSFQQIGYFNRPLSTVIFLIILILLFVYYFSFIFLAIKKKISINQAWFLILAAFAILVFSYNAFSYDLFNYIFDAKIVTFYHQNPYLHKALDFSNDPMLSFMRWTHRTYPYGPFWLMLTVPLSYLGMGYFLPTFFLFKLLMGFSFLGSSYLIYKISEKIFPENKLLNLAFWAFNPLVIIESLVSAHNDLPMIFFLLLSFYLFLQRKKFSSLITYAFSVGIKFSTGILFPLAIFVIFLEKTKSKINWGIFFNIAVLLSLITIAFAAIRTTFQPWYIIFPLSLAAFISKKYYISIPFFIASLFGVLIYVPYVFMTDYAKPYPAIVQNIEIAGIFSITLFTALFFLKTKLFSKH